MKKLLYLWICLFILTSFTACGVKEPVQLAATTRPVYEFTSRLCEGTDLRVGQLVTENVSCLHDYTLQVSQMRMIEEADAIIISGGGLEDFLDDIQTNHTVIDASDGINLLYPEHDHDSKEEHGHHHEVDPHYWLSPVYAKIMTENICAGLCELYPAYTLVFQENLKDLQSELDLLQQYGEQMLASLTTRELITFHDGFSYFADNFELTVLKAIEEESGQEASAAELKELILLVRDHQLPAVFTETNGSSSAADVIVSETGCSLYALDMAMSGDSYFASMYHNINTVKEALG